MGRTIATTAATVLFGFAVAVSPVHADDHTDDPELEVLPSRQQVQQQQKPLR